MPAWNEELEKGMQFGEAVDPGTQSSSDRLYALYVDEAEKYDNALVARLKTSSDSLLIFAGLFSATVTALLIESYAGLTQDSGDESAFYLVQIAQQLAANQLPSGAGNSTPLPFSPFPPFETPATAVRVNILWVLSLIVSLACALGATLIQTWMARYTRLVSQYANVSHRARQREFFFEGLKRSQLVVVAEALPALLHLSLFLFLVGLVEFLLQANNVVAYVALGATIAVSLAYGILTVMPFVSASSPYQTPLSVRMPKRINTLVRRHIERARRAYLPGRLLRGNGDVSTEFALRQSRALQWLLDRMTGAYNFDKFVEGIEPFLGSMTDSTKIIFQLNVKAEVGERRRDLSAHIGFRLHSCLDLSTDTDTRRTQVKIMAGALWNLFIRSDIMTGDIAPGGSRNRNERYPASRHLQQWLHPYTLRALRRLRHDDDAVISLYATCASMIILGRVLQFFCDQLRRDQVTVPQGWSFIRLLREYDTAQVDGKNVKTSFEFDVLTTCLLPPPELGQKSRAEEALDAFDAFDASSLNQSDFHPRRMSVLGESHATLTATPIRNTCRLAASQLLLEYLVNKTGSLQPTVTVVDMIQRTLKYVIVDTSAEGTDEDMQRSFVLLMERLFAAPDDLDLLGGRATFVLEGIQNLVETVSKTLDRPLWVQRALSIIRHARIENLAISESGRIGRVIFDAQPVQSDTIYFVSCEDRRDFLSVPAPATTLSFLVSNLRVGGDGQKWQSKQEGQYWSFKNLDTGTFLSVGPGVVVQEGASLRAAEYAPAAWNLRSVKADPSKYYICYGDTQYAIARDDANLDATAILSADIAKRIQWEFGSVLFNSAIKENAEYFLALAERETVVLDLSGWDNRTLLAYPINGGTNQKWNFFRDGEYWVIRCVHRDLFLDVNGVPSDGALLIASYEGRSRWDIRPDKAGKRHYNIFYAGTEFAAALDPDIGHGETISLSRSMVNRIEWKLFEYDQLAGSTTEAPVA